jgi:hypothetical protein
MALNESIELLIVILHLVAAILELLVIYWKI